MNDMNLLNYNSQETSRANIKKCSGRLENKVLLLLSPDDHHHDDERQLVLNDINLLLQPHFVSQRLLYVNGVVLCVLSNFYLPDDVRPRPLLLPPHSFLH